MVDIVLYPVKSLLFFCLNFCKLYIGINPSPHPSHAHLDMVFWGCWSWPFQGPECFEGNSFPQTYTIRLFFRQSYRSRVAISSFFLLDFRDGLKNSCNLIQARIKNKSLLPNTGKDNSLPLGGKQALSSPKWPSIQEPELLPAFCTHLDENQSL